MKFLRKIFKVLRLVGDVKAIKSGTYPKRVAKRSVRRSANRKINKLFK